jgi:excisionase family DNA binding protein
MKTNSNVRAHLLTQPDASDRLFTRDEVAAYLNIGTTFIEKLRRQGKLPSFQLSAKCVRYRKSDCDILLENCLIARPAKRASKEG